MRFLSVSKDGGPRSNTTAYWLAEIKSLFSVALLRFTEKDREEYHSHAFDSISWVLRGSLTENHLDGRVQRHHAGLTPVVTSKSTFHRVEADSTSWVLTFRGPWVRFWNEMTPDGKLVTLTHGRKEVGWIWFKPRDFREYKAPNFQ